MIQFVTKQLSISAVHPQPNPHHWPGPLGQDVHTPSTNVLQQWFLSLMHLLDYKDRYTQLINRCMLRQCKLEYCQNKKRKNANGYICRFNFLMDPVGFEQVYSEDESTIESLTRTNKAKQGAMFNGSDLFFLRNHRTTGSPHSTATNHMGSQY